MLALFTEVPQFCPRCGWPIKFASRDNRHEATQGVAQVCLKCELSYAVVARAQFVEAAGLCDTDLVNQVRLGGDA